MSTELVQMGAKAPDFALPRDGGETVRLADYSGRPVVLFFYPKASTPGCTTEACDFTARMADFEAAVKRCPNVLGCYLMSGEYDYLLRVAARDLEDYERIHRDWLTALPHAVKINSAFALREIIDLPNMGVDPERA